MIAAVVIIGVLERLPARLREPRRLARSRRRPAELVRPRRGGGRRSAPCAGLDRGAVVGLHAVFFVFHLDLQTFILIHISSMVAVYAVGMVAAVKLLRVGSAGWVMAVLSWS